jgi:hypothetical protein
MDGYSVVLFLHLSALLAAISTGALLHFAEARMRAADSVAAIGPSARLLARGAKVFPLALLALLGTGAYLVGRRWSWSAGWIDASLIGVTVLFIVGAGVIGSRSRALKRELRDISNGPVPPRLAYLTREHAGGIASWTNTGLALGIVFVMTTKPTLAGSLASLVIAVTLGAVVALRLRRLGGPHAE